MIPDDTDEQAPAERPEELRLIEALLFAAGEPLDEKTLRTRLPEGVDIEAAMRRLQHLPDQEVQILDLPSQYQEGAPATVVEQAEGALLEEREVASDQGDRGAKLVRKCCEKEIFLFVRLFKLLEKITRLILSLPRPKSSFHSADQHRDSYRALDHSGVYSSAKRLKYSFCVSATA